MSDQSTPQFASAADLGERVASLLEPLGGRTAVAAQRFGPLPSQRLTIMPARGAGPSANGAHREAAAEVTQVSIRADEVFPAASLAKLPIAIELMRRADLGQFDLRERLDTSDTPRVGGAGVLDVLDPSTRLTLGELCALMLVVSDNTAANVVLTLIGMGEVNETMARLNLTRTKLARSFMDQAARASGRDNVTSAGDMLTLLSLIRGNALPGGRKLRETLAAQQSFSELTEGWLPTSATLAHKDGTLEGVVHDAGIVSGPSGVAMYCILTAEQENIPEARATIGRIVRLFWDAWRLG
ncbi:MAG TPA: serine hydrolase [Ktedonobacterales bacterium]|nr:serine hydrolase [Ktedonobacterales bacterium]